MNGLSQGNSCGGRDGFDSIYPCGFLALILLGHSSDGDESGRPRRALTISVAGELFSDLHVQRLSAMRFCRWYRCCSNLRQGSAAHSSLGCASGALVSSMRLTPLHSTRSDLRQHILGVIPGIGFSDHPSRQMHAVGTCSCHRPSMRVLCWLLRSDSPFCVACRLLLSAGFDGSAYRSPRNMSAPILVHFGPSPALACGYWR